MTRSVLHSTLSRRGFYQAVSELLTASDHLPEFSDDQWKALIRFSGDALIAAQLYERLNSSGLVDQLPGDISLYLQEVHRLNTLRSAGLISTFTRLCRSLNAKGIDPIALKGISLMLGERPGEPLRSTRITSDIDVLVRADELEPSLSALKYDGYRQIVNPIGKDTKADNDDLLGEIDLADFRNNLAYARSHVPPVVDDDGVCVIELHLAAATLNNPRAKKLTNIVFFNSEPITDGTNEITYAIPDPATQLVLAVYHAHIKNAHQFLGIVDWRLLLDLSAISQAYPQTDVVADTMRVSEQLNMAQEMYTAWALMARYLHSDINLKNVETKENLRALYWFDQKSEWKWLASGCTFWLQIQKSYTLFSPREIRQSLGPHINIANSLAHLSYRIRRRLNSR